jgi:phosphoglycerate dehydrogenase-like enzyme
MELLVLREGVHRYDAETYATKLRERLDDHTVRYAGTPAEERRVIANADVVTGPRIDADLLERADELDLFACAYAGYGHLPLDSFVDFDVQLTNAAGIHAPNAAEHAIGAMLAFSRRFHDASRADTWQPFSPG